MTWADALTPMEAKVLAGMMARKTNEEIARETCYSLRYVMNAANAVYQKLGIPEHPDRRARAVESRISELEQKENTQ